MEVIRFSTLINAPVQKVWHTMLDDKPYREWTMAFAEGSYYEGDWNKGSEIRFLGPDQNGKLQGMFSRIKESIYKEFISIEHVSIIKDGEVDTTSDEVKKWAPSFENYTFTPKGNQTKLEVQMQIPMEYKTMFEDMWPKALQILKTLCEQD